MLCSLDLAHSYDAVLKNRGDKQKQLSQSSSSGEARSSTGTLEGWPYSTMVPSFFLESRANGCSSSNRGRPTKQTVAPTNNVAGNERAQFQCDFCAYSTDTSSCMRAHIRVHSDERPYECSFCLRRFKLKQHVQNHESIHTGAKPFKCNHCPYSTPFSQNLARHKRIHLK